MKKFAHRYLGACRFICPVSLHAYHLELSISMSQIHPVFHVVKLLPVPPDPIEGRHTKPPSPEIIEEEKSYEVERQRRLQYLII
jgi:hypothetical protein